MMNSTSFPGVVSPLMSGMPRRFQSGGSTTETPFSLPNDIGYALYGQPPSPAQQEQVTENAFLQGDPGGIPTSTMATGGRVKPKHNLTVIMPIIPASPGVQPAAPPTGALGRSMMPTPQQAGSQFGQKAHAALAAVQEMVGIISAMPGVDQQAVATAKAYLRQGADLLLSAAKQAATRGQQ